MIVPMVSPRVCISIDPIARKEEPEDYNWQRKLEPVLESIGRNIDVYA